jgi:endonuclease YncB( thermonuclease family)/uncharacterized membrane protein YkvA (DUF1232 family)
MRGWHGLPVWWQRLRQRARLGTRLLALWKLLRHPATPWYVKAVAAVVVAYAVSPIDLIPDFIPVLGQIDDLILVPLGVALAVRLAPPALWQACLREAEAEAGRVPGLLWGAVLVVLVWLLVLGAFAVWLVSVLASPASAATPPREVPGTVTRVVDGDTLWFQPAAPGEPALAVRLRGIDAPESCQAWGAQARRALREQAEGRAAVLQLHGQDEYRRTLAVIFVAGADLNARLVEDGHAWAWLDRVDRGLYTTQQQRARAARLGLHADPAAQAPWSFRREHGRCRR